MFISEPDVGFRYRTQSEPKYPAYNLCSIFYSKIFEVGLYTDDMAKCETSAYKATDNFLQDSGLDMSDVTGNKQSQCNNYRSRNSLCTKQRVKYELKHYTTAVTDNQDESFGVTERERERGGRKGGFVVGKVRFRRVLLSVAGKRQLCLHPPFPTVEEEHKVIF